MYNSRCNVLISNVLQSVYYVYGEMSIWFDISGDLISKLVKYEIVLIHIGSISYLHLL